GGDWEFINTFTDTGNNWAVDTDCSEHNPVNGSSMMSLLEGGTVFIRNTSITEARYKWMSVREINVP
ncbi:MAG: hypothetical protein HRU38_23780, partial [Saccharospirillaceae bacterium]|nr:hypothetical protein [Pseudomonadales bacterium]NRB81643.1 hypothetical protein [Saccharospirillaceae bacterium]